MSEPRRWGVEGGQENELYLSMSDVVTSMGDVGDGGDHTKRETPVERDSTHANYDNTTHRASIETRIVAIR